MFFFVPLMKILQDLVLQVGWEVGGGGRKENNRIYFILGLDN